VLTSQNPRILIKSKIFNGNLLFCCCWRWFNCSALYRTFYRLYPLKNRSLYRPEGRQRLLGSLGSVSWVSFPAEMRRSQPGIRGVLSQVAGIVDYFWQHSFNSTAHFLRIPGILHSNCRIWDSRIHNVTGTAMLLRLLLLAVHCTMHQGKYYYLQTVQYSCISMNIPKFLDIKISIPVPPVWKLGYS